MDENSVSFQLFLILLSFIIALGSENQISVFKQCQSKTQMSGFFLGGGEGGGRGSMHRSQNLEKNHFIRDQSVFITWGGPEEFVIAHI